jgi:hypothetical protein
VERENRFRDCNIINAGSGIFGRRSRQSDDVVPITSRSAHQQLRTVTSRSIGHRNELIQPPSVSSVD